MSKPIPELTELQLMKFWAKVSKQGDDECWPWTGALMWKGYGVLTLNKSVYRACRVMLALTGVEDTSLVCRHSCHNPACVNPKHLSLGTHKDNAKDKTKAGREYRGERHHNTKLTPADVLAIRDLLKTKIVKSISRKYAVSKQVIYDIKSGNTWKHVL